MKLSKKSLNTNSLLTPHLFQAYDLLGDQGGGVGNGSCNTSNGFACSGNSGNCTNNYAVCFNEPQP